MKEKVMDKFLYWDESSDRQRLVGLLKEDEVVISSTDTIFGFLGDASSESYDRICSLKGISSPRPYLILVASIEKLPHFVDVDNVSRRIIRFLKRGWPGPITAIFRAKPGLPKFLTGNGDTIAIRCPEHAGLQAILPEFEGLFSTSANKTKETPPATLSAINPKLLHAVPAVVVDRGQEEVVKAKPSSIIDFSQVDSSFRVVREGVYSTEELKEMYEKAANE